MACLAALSGPTFTADPCPEPPESFRCPRRVQQMNGAAGKAPAPENAGQSVPPVPPAGEPEGAERWSPTRLVRTCVASLGRVPRSAR